MHKETIEYSVPFQDEESCKKHNEMCQEIYGDDFTPIQPTEEHMDNLVDKLFDAFDRIAEEAGWYLGEGIKIKIEIEYEPEDK